MTFLNVLFTKPINYSENKSQVKEKSYSCATDTNGEEVTTCRFHYFPKILKLQETKNQLRQLHMLECINCNR